MAKQDSRLDSMQGLLMGEKKATIFDSIRLRGQLIDVRKGVLNT